MKNNENLEFENLKNFSEEHRIRIEKVKEMLFYDELTLSEIAFRMDYSSAAYLSTQFKRETGMTPTQFRNTHEPGHRHIDCL